MGSKWCCAPNYSRVQRKIRRFTMELTTTRKWRAHSSRRRFSTMTHHVPFLLTLKPATTSWMAQLRNPQAQSQWAKKIVSVNCGGRGRWCRLRYRLMSSLRLSSKANLAASAAALRSAAYNPAHLSLDAKSSTHTTSAFIDTHNKYILILLQL